MRGIGMEEVAGLYETIGLCINLSPAMLLFYIGDDMDGCAIGIAVPVRKAPADRIKPARRIAGYEVRKFRISVYSAFRRMGFPQWGQVRLTVSVRGGSKSSITETSRAAAIRSNTSTEGLPLICWLSPTRLIPIFSASSCTERPFSLITSFIRKAIGLNF